MQSKDNLPTRICFSVPSVAASSIVVGDMMASTLGGHPGRGIYQLGSSKIVQTPFLETLELEALMNAHREKLKAQGYKRTVFQRQGAPSTENNKNEVLV